MIKSLGLYQKSFLILILFLFLIPSGLFSKARPQEIQNVDFTEKLGAQVSLDLKFRDTNGHLRPLSDFFSHGKVVILNLAYFNCPMLCNMVSSGLAEGLAKSKMPLGDKYQVLTISINPLETQEDALRYKARFFELLKANDSQQAYWEFLTGSPDQIKQLADQVGFGYRYNPNTKEYAHGAGIIVLSKKGQVMRYLYGIEYRPFDLKMSILEASENKVKSTVEKVMVFCYNYDPNRGKYALFSMSLMRYSALLTVFLIGIFIVFLIKKSKKESE